MVSFVRLFKRIQQLTGIKLTKQVHEAPRKTNSKKKKRHVFAAFDSDSACGSSRRLQRRSGS
jgi:hypothetical protein